MILFDERGDGRWCSRDEEEYPDGAPVPWLSGNVSNLVCDPHAGIIGDRKGKSVLDMTAGLSKENQKVCVDLVKGDTNNLKSSVYRLAAKDTLDRWLDKDVIAASGYEMPRRLDWNLFKRIYDIQPRNYEEFLSIPGVNRATVRALSLIAELIYGAPASWDDQ